MKLEILRNNGVGGTRCIPMTSVSHIGTLDLVIICYMKVMSNMKHRQIKKTLIGGSLLGPFKNYVPTEGWVGIVIFVASCCENLWEREGHSSFVMSQRYFLMYIFLKLHQVRAKLCGKIPKISSFVPYKWPCDIILSH